MQQKDYFYIGKSQPNKMATFSIKTFFLNWIGPSLLGISWIGGGLSGVQSAIVFIVGLSISLIRTGFWMYRAVQNNKMKALQNQKMFQDNWMQRIEIEERELSILERRRNLSGS